DAFERALRLRSGDPAALVGNGLALGEYFGDLVVFGTRGAQFWSVDPDFTKNQYLRSLKTSLLARRSVTGYADGDVLYLSTTGIRSLQARDSSNFAKVSDVGSPIDILLRAELDFAGADVEPIFQDHDRNVTRFLQLAKGIIHEQSGQFWLCLKEKVYVLTNYPAAKVRAWSVFDLPVTTHFNPTVGLLKGRWVGDICAIRDDLIMRNNADEVFIYGGITGSTYDRSEVEVVTPHMDMGKPSTVKRFTGIDMACYGEWQVEVSLDVNNVEWEPVAVIDGSTHRVYRVGFDLEGTHLALRLRSTTPGPAKIGQVTVLYAGGEGEK
uniref:hypothetical protein n=1 Tax=uncultured Amaricoccus sp. TaxID=339341 RepID=UPI00261D03E8